MRQLSIFALALGFVFFTDPGRAQTPEAQNKNKPSAQTPKAKEKPDKPAKTSKSGDPKTTSSQADATAAAYKKGLSQGQPSAPK